MDERIIAQKLSANRSTKLEQRKDGSAILWLSFATRPDKDTGILVAKEKVESTIQQFQLEPC